MTPRPRRWIGEKILLVSLAVLALPHPARCAEPIPIGYYGPTDSNHPIGGSVWEGVQLAFEEANAGDRRYRLVPGWDENPWSGGATTVVRMAYEEKVVAIIGSINGDATHLAEQVVAKARLPLIDPASTDRTVNAAFVPWMFSVMPDDRSFMRTLMADLPAEPFVLLTATNHDSRMMTTEFLRMLGKRRPLRHLEFEHTEEVAADAARIDAGAIVILAGPSESAELVRQLRTLKPAMRLYGSQTVGRRTFVEQAGQAAKGVRFPSAGELDTEFRAAFRIRYGHDPDYAAAHAYDAARMLILAIQEAGADRTAVRDALESLPPYAGVSGAITWDRLRRNSRETVIETIDR